MVISILTLFPQMFTGPFDFSIVKRAKGKKLVEISLINIRDFAVDKYKTVDDHPFGGGVGMVMKVDVVDRALIFSKNNYPKLKPFTILLDPKGQTFTQAKARELTEFEHLILICGHYEGVDARVTKLVDESISIGNYILTGGELPAMVLVDSMVRLIPGVLQNSEATVSESFNQNLLEPPQYTRPQTYKKWGVPDVLVSGHHQKINEWKTKHSPKINPKGPNPRFKSHMK